MSAVQQALAKLSHAIGNLEGAMDSLETDRKGEQRDMFAAPARKPPPANTNTVDRELVAGKLDSAIAKIEAVLKEGRR